MRPSKDHPRNIAELSAQYETLKTKKITAEANLQTSSNALADLKTQAQEKYGTDDLVKLQAKLEEMTKENERKRDEYQAHLTAIVNQLTVVETDHANAANKESET